MDRGALSATAALAAAGLLALAGAAAPDGGASSPRGPQAGGGEQEPAPSSDAERPLHERIDEPALVVCGGCHTEVYAEWSESLHRRAWTNANVRRATDDFAKTSCRPCHSPAPIAATGLTRRPGYRDVNQADGVHCLSCHAREDGVMAARTIEDAPCRPRFDERLVDVDHCYPCHEPTHQAYSEFDGSDAAALGLRCADCHMPPVARAGGRLGRSHGPHGGMDADFVRRGLRWEARAAERDGARGVEVELANRTGHKFPGEIPSRSLWLVVEPDGGERVDVLLRKPHKGEDRADDRLRPDEVRTLFFPAPDGAASARVRVLFRPLPLLAEEACHDLGEEVVTLE